LRVPVSLRTLRACPEAHPATSEPLSLSNIEIRFSNMNYYNVYFLQNQERRSVSTYKKKTMLSADCEKHGLVLSGMKVGSRDATKKGYAKKASFTR
jgi:hypothetical protein